MFWKKNKKIEIKIDEDALFKDITQDVIMNMMSMNVIKTPELKFFVDDKGILDGLVQEHITRKKILALKRQSDFSYMFVCGMHALGAGIVVTAFQIKVNRSVNEFTQQDLNDIALCFSKVDAYELALSTMRIDANSNNKKIMDQIIITAIKSAMNYAGENATSPDTIRQFMRVLFNAGITVVKKTIDK